MALVKITGLPGSTGIDTNVDALAIVHGGVTQKITPQALFNTVLTSPGPIGLGIASSIRCTTLTTTSSVTAASLLVTGSATIPTLTITGSASIPFTPVGTISATTVSSALIELGNEKASTTDLLSGLSLKTNVADLAAIGGAALVGFKQTDASTLRTLDAKSKERVSVLDFGADPTGVADSSTAFNNAMAAAKVVTVPLGGIYKLNSTITRPNTCILEVEPTTTFTGVGEILNSGTAYGNTIPTKTVFGKLTIRDSSYTPSSTNGFVSYPNVGQILRLDGKTAPGQCGVYLSGDEREPVISSVDYVGLHSRHNNSVTTPKVWGYNPVVIKSADHATCGTNTAINGIEISLSNNTSECAEPQQQDCLQGLYISYIRDAGYASAALSTGGYASLVPGAAGWKYGLWIDGVCATGTLISLRDEVSANSGVARGVDFVSVSSFTDGAITFNNGHTIVGKNTSGTFVDLLQMSTANQVTLGQEGTSTAILGIPSFPGNTTSHIAGVDIGISTTTSSYIDFHSSGNSNDYDFRLYATSGTTVGTGILQAMGTTFSMACDVKPGSDNTKTLGSATSRWLSNFTGYINLSTVAPTAAAGTINLGGTIATTVGAAGGASALPATPLGYMIANVAGTTVKIPYYSN